jgi:hypothetical protein
MSPTSLLASVHLKDLDPVSVAADAENRIEPLAYRQYLATQQWHHD